MTTKTSIPRLHSVRLKSGGATVRVLYGRTDERRREIEDRVRGVLDVHQDFEEIGGFAFICWGKTGGVTTRAINFDSCIPSILIPDFARNSLLAEVIEDWTREGMASG